VRLANQNRRIDLRARKVDGCGHVWLIATEKHPSQESNRHRCEYRRPALDVKPRRAVGSPRRGQRSTSRLCETPRMRQRVRSPGRPWWASSMVTPVGREQCHSIGSSPRGLGAHFKGTHGPHSHRQPSARRRDLQVERHLARFAGPSRQCGFSRPKTPGLTRSKDAIGA